MFSKKVYEYNLYQPVESIFFSVKYANQTAVGSTTSLYYSCYVSSPYDSYTDSFKTNNIFDADRFSLYPMAVRYAQPHLGFYVIERPPFKISIDYSLSRSYGSRKQPKFLNNREIWVPWTVSVIALNPSVLNISPRFSPHYSFSIYFNDRPLSSFDDTLLNSYFPNSSSASICFGQDSNSLVDLIQKDPFDISSIYNKAFADSFSGWNSDLQPIISYTSVFNFVFDRLKNSFKPPSFSRKKPSDWPYNKVIENALGVYSEMTLEETLAHVAEAKTDRYSNYSRITFSKILENNSIDFDSQSPYNLSRYGYQAQHLRQSYSSALKSKLVNSSFYAPNVTVNISDFRSLTSIPPQIVNQIVSNPFIVSQIYRSVIEQYHKPEDEREFICLDYSLESIQQYLNIPQELPTNVVSS